MRKLVSVLVAPLCLALTPHGDASANDIVDPAIDIQLFQYAIGPRSFLTVTDGEVAAAKQISADLLLTFLTSPFIVYNYDEALGEPTDVRSKVVKSMLAAEVSGAYGITDRLQVGLSLPVILSMSGDGLDPVMATPTADGLQISGLGDLRVEGQGVAITIRWASHRGRCQPYGPNELRHRKRFPGR